MSAQLRVDLNGYPIRDLLLEDSCAECGMALTKGAEFHPWRACELFKQVRSGETVWKMMRSEGIVPDPDHLRTRDSVALPDPDRSVVRVEEQ